MNRTSIIPEPTAPVQAPRQEREKECVGCGQFARFTGYACPACAPRATNVPEAPRKITLPKPSRRETYAAGCCRLAHQGYLNGARVRPVLGQDYAHNLTWAVTSQRDGGGYSVTQHTAAGTWSCGCEAHAGGKLCAHISLCRTWVTECPTCSAPLVAYADRVPDERRCTGAVRCLGSCGLVTDLTGEEAEALQEAHLGVHTLPVLGLLLVVVRRVERQSSEVAA